MTVAEDMFEIFENISNLYEADRLIESMQEQLAVAKALRASIAESMTDSMLGSDMVREEFGKDEMLEYSREHILSISGKVHRLKLMVQTKLHTGINKEVAQEAFEWMHNNGYDDLIRCVVTSKFDRNQIKDALAFAEKNSSHVELKIEPSTMRKAMRERLQKGQYIPSNLINAYYEKNVQLTDLEGGTDDEE